VAWDSTLFTLGTQSIQNTFVPGHEEIQMHALKARIGNSPDWRASRPSQCAFLYRVEHLETQAMLCSPEISWLSREIRNPVYNAKFPEC
jgi:hypothetical protein